MDAWLRSLLWEAEVPGPPKGPSDHVLGVLGKVDIHRLKGRAIMKTGKTLLIQGVRDVFEIYDAPSPRDGEDGGKIVLIGRGLRDVDLRGSLEWFLSQGRAG